MAASLHADGDGDGDIEEWSAVDHDWAYPGDAHQEHEEGSCSLCLERGLDPDTTPHGFEHATESPAMIVCYIWLPPLARTDDSPARSMSVESSWQPGETAQATHWSESDSSSTLSLLRDEYQQAHRPRRCLFRLRTPMAVRKGGKLTVHRDEGFRVEIPCVDVWSSGEYLAASLPKRDVGMCGWPFSSIAPTVTLVHRSMAERALQLLYSTPPIPSSLIDIVCAYHGDFEARLAQERAEIYEEDEAKKKARISSQDEKPRVTMAAMNDADAPPLFRSLFVAEEKQIQARCCVLYQGQRCVAIRQAVTFPYRLWQERELLVTMRKAEQTFQPVVIQASETLETWYRQVWAEADAYSGHCWLLRNLAPGSPRPWHLLLQKDRLPEDPEVVGWSTCESCQPYSQRLYFELLQQQGLPPSGVAHILDFLAPLHMSP